MLKLITGKKGSGKTKQLVSMVNDAVGSTNGKVVCIVKGNKLTYDIDHSVRLFNTDDYAISGVDSFYGFIAGIIASDYDVKEIYVDSVMKTIGGEKEKIDTFFEKVNAIASKEGINVVMTVSGDASELSEVVGKYIFVNLT